MSAINFAFSSFISQNYLASTYTLFRMVLPFHPIQHEPPTATLSQFEQLPRELVFEVLGYVPEKVFDLRLVRFIRPLKIAMILVRRISDNES